MSQVDSMPEHAERILIVLPDLERGGGQRVLMQLAESFFAAGREVHVAALLGGGALRAKVPGGVVLHELARAGQANNGLTLALSAFPKLLALLGAMQPHAILSSITGANLLAALAHWRSRGECRLVLREAASLINTKSILRRQGMRWLYRRADALIAVSAGVAEDLRGLGIADTQIHVIHNPIDAQRLQQRASIGPLPVAKDKLPYVVSVGRLVEQKDQRTLLYAYAASALRKSHCLVITGEGGQRKSLERLAHDLGIVDRMILTGELDNPYRVLSAASLHVLSSRWEGYPNVLLEALALGVPVVSTDCPHGPRELLDGGRYGRLAPVGDPVALARAMDEELARPSPGIESVVAAHQSRTIASGYLALLDGLSAVPSP